jgi:hypothetical protein
MPNAVLTTTLKQKLLRFFTKRYKTNYTGLLQAVRLLN